MMMDFLTEPPAVHLLDLKAVFRKHPPSFQHRGHSLINFERSAAFTAWTKKFLQFKAPRSFDLDHSGPLAYLENQLRDRDITEDDLEKLSLTLASEEDQLLRFRVPQFQSLGFRT